MTVPATALSQLKDFQSKPKFLPDTLATTPGGYYTGLGNPALQRTCSELINQAAADFQTVARFPHPTEAQFHEQMDKGLARFAPIYLELDSEDQDRVCFYYEELMTIVGLQSSGGQLNTWRYGFDPKPVNAQ